jgi:K+-sensing histidine kinase KdpD
VRSDPTYVERVVSNLLSNAHKYSDTGAKVEVQVEPGKADDVLVTVRDHGAVITSEDAVNFFERFHRASATSEKASGAGIGLTVCKRLIEALGGEIWATPRDEGGLEVSFTLPRYPEDDAVEDDEAVFADALKA